MGSGTVLKTVVSKHSWLLHLQMHVKTPPCEAKAIYQQHPEMLLTHLGPKLICDGLAQNGTMCCGRTSTHFKLFSENKDVVSSGLKRKRTKYM